MDILIADLKNQIAIDKLTKVSDTRDHFISLSLHLAPKSNMKWRHIYYLSYLYGYLVNYYIA